MPLPSPGLTDQVNYACKYWNNTGKTLICIWVNVKAIEIY